jgi:hypothetical protein
MLYKVNINIFKHDNLLGNRLNNSRIFYKNQILHIDYLNFTSNYISTQTIFTN